MTMTGVKAVNINASEPFQMTICLVAMHNAQIHQNLFFITQEF
jgi:hypothetical protein